MDRRGWFYSALVGIGGVFLPPILLKEKEAGEKAGEKVGEKAGEKVGEIPIAEYWDIFKESEPFNGSGEWGTTIDLHDVSITKAKFKALGTAGFRALCRDTQHRYHWKVSICIKLL